MKVATCLGNCPGEFKVIIFKRYVDNCFVAFRGKEHVDKFLDYFNTKHRNII